MGMRLTSSHLMISDDEIEDVAQSPRIHLFTLMHEFGNRSSPKKRHTQFPFFKKKKKIDIKMTLWVRLWYFLNS